MQQMSQTLFLKPCWFEVVERDGHHASWQAAHETALILDVVTTVTSTSTWYCTAVFYSYIAKAFLVVLEALKHVDQYNVCNNVSWVAVQLQAVRAKKHEVPPLAHC